MGKKKASSFDYIILELSKRGVPKETVEFLIKEIKPIHDIQIARAFMDGKKQGMDEMEAIKNGKAILNKDGKQYFLDIYGF